MSARLSQAVAAVLILTAPAAAQPAKLVKEYEANLKRFGEEQARAKGVVLAAFDTEVKAAGNAPGLLPSARLARQKQLKEAKDRFATSGDWPGPNLGFFGAEWNYAGAVNKVYVPLSVSMEKLIDAHVKAGNTAAGEQVLAQKQKLEEQFPGVGQFAAGSKWAGTRFAPNGDTMPADLHLTEVTDGVLFQGRVVAHPKNAPPVVMTVSGQREGLHVVFRNTAVISGGKQRALAFDGAISGRRLLLSIGGIGPNGKPAGGFAVLQRQGK